MRAALWRNARLAAVGTAVAKISHDLRNILSSALLVADRLQETDDPTIKRAARTLIPAVERAAQLVSRTVDFAREGPPAIIRSSVGLRDLIDETALALRPDETGVTIENNVPDTLVLALDREQIYRVLVNLMRNAVEAGADHITISVTGENGMTRLNIRDNGPGLPAARAGEPVQAFHRLRAPWQHRAWPDHRPRPGAGAWRRAAAGADRAGRHCVRHGTADGIRRVTFGVAPKTPLNPSEYSWFPLLTESAKRDHISSEDRKNSKKCLFSEQY